MPEGFGVQLDPPAGVDPLDPMVVEVLDESARRKGAERVSDWEHRVAVDGSNVYRCEVIRT